MYSKAGRTVGCILGTLATYGNVLTSTIKASQHIQKQEVLIRLYITKHVLIKMMLGRENYISNLEKANVILRQD